MSTNPFEDEGAPFKVLCNAEEQYSIWPDFIEIPDGWTAKYGPDTRAACLAYVEKSWTDMRPNSLIEQMTDRSR